MVALGRLRASQAFAVASLLQQVLCLQSRSRLRGNASDFICKATPEAVCAGIGELCFFDSSCSDKHPKAGGLGCNAGGVHQNCRFCGFGSFLECPLSQAELCSRAIRLNFTEPSRRNIGGFGPDADQPHNLRYDYITKIGESEVDLVITALTPYRVHDAEATGLEHNYGVIDFDADQTVALQFAFQERGREVEMDKFFFSIMEFDNDAKASASVVVGGQSDFTLANASNYRFWYVGGSLVNLTSVRPRTDDAGAGRPHPAIATFTFTRTRSFTITFATYGGPAKLRFGGSSSLVCDGEGDKVPCRELPANLCSQHSGEFCYFDRTCSQEEPRLGGLGCNAGGVGQNCRFCGFTDSTGLKYEECPAQ